MQQVITKHAATVVRQVVVEAVCQRVFQHLLPFSLCGKLSLAQPLQRRILSTEILCRNNLIILLNGYFSQRAVAAAHEIIDKVAILILELLRSKVQRRRR